MEGSEGNREIIENFRSINGFSRDLMLMKCNHANEEREGGENEEMELSLGLSMNGRFGADPKRKKLKRSSSVSNMVVTNNVVAHWSNPQACEEASGCYVPPVRACSMPETPEWRHREEFQLARSTEKLKNSAVAKENDSCSEDVDVNGLHVGSNGVSHHQGQLVKEATQNPMTHGSSSSQFEPESAAERPAVTAVATEVSLLNTLIDMPCVSTRGYEPNHEKIEGFLYRYKRAEEVKIVCVCHGFFLSPAEFVKHGGGGNVSYPLKHIVVNPFPLS